jgi:hypothetical protein
MTFLSLDEKANDFTRNRLSELQLQRSRFSKRLVELNSALGYCQAKLYPKSVLSRPEVFK